VERPKIKKRKNGLGKRCAVDKTKGKPTVNFIWCVFGFSVYLIQK